MTRAGDGAGAAPPIPARSHPETEGLVAEIWHHVGLPAFVHHYLHRIARHPRRERLFLASVSFFLTALGVRALTHAIRLHLGPFGNVGVGGTHIHHLVWGILTLLLVGYLWLGQFGTRNPASDWPSRITALLYGFGAALTLDEFALWLNLKDVYWERQGKESVDALMIFFGLLSVGVWGRGLLDALLDEMRALARHVHRPIGRRARHR